MIDRSVKCTGTFRPRDFWRQAQPWGFPGSCRFRWSPSLARAKRGILPVIPWPLMQRPTDRR